MANRKMLTFLQQLKEQGVKIDRLQALLSKYKYQELIKFEPQDYNSTLLDLDMQQFCGRYKTSGLPDYLDDFMLERILYLRGSFCAFVQNGILYCLPYAIDGELNVYGLPESVKPIGLNGEDFPSKALKVYYNGIPNKNAECVIVYDRVPVWQAGHVVSRAVFNTELRNLMATTLAKAECNLQNSAKKITVKVGTSDQVDATKTSINDAMYSNDPYVVITDENDIGKDSEIFNNGVDNELDKYMQFYAGLNNLRCENMGILNNGTFLKSERSINSEISGNDYQSNLILEMGLKTRQSAWENLAKLYPKYTWLKDIQTVINVSPYIVKGEIEDDDYNEDKEGSGFNEYNNNI